MQVSRFYIIVIFCFCSFFSQGQKKISLELININSNKELFNKINYKKTFSDSLSLYKQLNKIVSFLHQKSYLTASYDSIQTSDKSVKAYLSIGNSFLWATLKKGNLSDEIIRQVDFKEKIYRNKKFSYEEVTSLEKKIVENAENNGYPFAEIELENISISNNSIEATLHFTPGSKILFDSIGIIGNAQIKRKFLSNYLQIKKQENYDQRKINNIKPLLQKLNIANMKREPEVRFINGNAYVYLFLNEKKTTGIDGIAAIQQDPEIENRILFTGEFNLNLRNILQSGKRAQLHWQKLSRGTSSLESSYTQPALLGSPLEIGALFNFLDQDSTYIMLNYRFNLKYNLLRFGTIGFFYEQRSTRLIDTSIFSNATALPTFSDSKTNSYGINYEWNNLDNYFLPHKGTKIMFEVFPGNKKINKVLRNELYEGITINTIQLQGIAQLEHHSFINQNFTLVKKLSGALIDNERLFFNDLYRIGGINSLRGFREQSFFVSKYLIETLELRFFTEETSYFMVFIDYGQYVTEVEGAWDRNSPLGLGGGISITTKAGIFNMVYALGKEKGQQINFNNSVVNFGLVSRF